MPEDSRQNISLNEIASLSDNILKLERELQSLRLELYEKDRLLASVRNDLAIHMKNSENEADREVRVRFEKLFADLGGYVVQMLAQEYMSNIEGKNIQAKDLLAVATRSISCLKSHGLEFIGSMGETAAFDPRIHEPLSLEEKFDNGDCVTIRLVGLSLSNSIIRRAAVVRELAKSV